MGIALPAKSNASQPLQNDNTVLIKQLNDKKLELENLVKDNTAGIKTKKLNNDLSEARKQQFSAGNEQLKNTAKSFIFAYDGVTELIELSKKHLGTLPTSMSADADVIQSEIDKLQEYIARFDHANKKDVLEKHDTFSMEQEFNQTGKTISSSSKQEEEKKVPAAPITTKENKEKASDNLVYKEAEEEQELNKLFAGLRWAEGQKDREKQAKRKQAEAAATAAERKNQAARQTQWEELYTIQITEAKNMLVAIQNVLKNATPEQCEISIWLQETPALLSEFNKELPNLINTSLLGVMARLMHCIGLFSLHFPQLQFQNPSDILGDKKLADPYHIRNAFVHHQDAYKNQHPELLAGCTEAVTRITDLVSDLEVKNTSNFKVPLKSSIFYHTEVEKINALYSAKPAVLVKRIKNHLRQLELLERVADAINKTNPENYTNCTLLHWMISTQVLAIGEALTSLKKQSTGVYNLINNAAKKCDNLHGYLPVFNHGTNTEEMNDVNVFQYYRNKMVHQFHTKNDHNKYKSIEPISPQTLKGITAAVTQLLENNKLWQDYAAKTNPVHTSGMFANTRTNDKSGKDEEEKQPSVTMGYRSDSDSE